MAKSKPRRSGAGDRRTETNCRGAMVFACMILGACGVSGFAFHVQIKKHSTYLGQAQARYMGKLSRTGQRGRIYLQGSDTAFNLLAGNQTTQDIFVQPHKMLRKTTKEDIRDEMVDGLAYMLGANAQRLDRRIQAVLDRRELAKTNREIESIGRISVMIGADVALAQQVKAMSEMNGWGGIVFEERISRYYPKGKMLANTLGFINAEGVGQHGIERAFQDELMPASDTQFYEKTAKGRPVMRDAVPDLKELDGASIYLTIDEAVQAIVDAELVELAEKFAPKHAYAIMVEPSSGAIMAMSQLPAYDANVRSDASLFPNRLLEDAYDPGSTMKCVSLAGALDFGVVDLDTLVDCHNGYWGEYRLRDTHDYDQLTVAEIIQHSSNIGTAQVAFAMGTSGLYQTLRRFGFGERTELSRLFEQTGKLRQLHRWDRYSITRFPMGQGISATPMQMVQAYCGLANSGVIMQLRLVERIVDPRTGITTKFPQLERQRAVRPEAAHKMVEAMKLVVSDGTAKLAQVPGFAVAGKTGTAQKWVNGAYSHSQYYVSFVGFVPAHKPKFVLLVAADEPTKRSYYGGTVCGPTFSRIAQRCLDYLNVAPTVAEIADEP